MVSSMGAFLLGVCVGFVVCMIIIVIFFDSG